MIRIFWLWLLLQSLPALLMAERANWSDLQYIKNYSRSNYNAGQSLVSCAMDKHGILYFASFQGIVKFDGEEWNVIPDTKNVTTIQSDSENRIYVGKTRDFGYLENDSIGEIHYISLFDLIPEVSNNFDEVFQVEFVKDDVYFQSYQGIYKWDGYKIEFLNIIDAHIFNIDGEIYFSDTHGYFGKLNRERNYFENIDIGEDMIYQVLPYKEEQKLVITHQNGLFLFNSSRNELSRFNCEASAFLADHNFYDGTQITEDTYALGSLNSGLIFTNSHGEIVKKVNMENGLFSNMIFDVLKGKNNKIWLATADGISRIDLRIVGLGTDAEKYDDANIILSSITVDNDTKVYSGLSPSFSEQQRTTNIDLDHPPGILAIDFSIPEMAGDQIFYSIKLEGYDKHFSPFSSRNYVNYTALKGGEYKFFVVAKNDNGIVANFEPLSIKIKDFWYQSSWFYAAGTIFLVFFILVLLKANAYKLEKDRARLEKLVDLKTIDLQNQQSKLQTANQELIVTNQELDNFVYHTSHDLKAPLKSILGLINIAKTDQIHKTPTYLDMMEKSVFKLEEFIASIVEYSANARIKVDEESFDFGELVNDVFDELRYQEKSAKIRLINDVVEGSMLFSDRKRLKIILSNLISNAIKYSDFSKLDSYVLVQMKIGVEKIIINVKDNGIGIDENLKEKVFDMFYRATERSNGSGLGLYIVKETALKLGLELCVDSTAGQGTTFRLLMDKDKVLLPKIEGDQRQKPELADLQLVNEKLKTN